MQSIYYLISQTNTILWTYVLIGLLIGLGVFFTIRSRFVQFRMIKEMGRLLGEGAGSKQEGVSSFQAFCIGMASRVGTGNIAGVATAIALGGPGAMFWMWIISLIGAATGFIESTLAQIYKVKDGNSFRGGPAYYMEKALQQRWLGILFSIFITICFGFIFNAVQSNTIAESFNSAFSIGKPITAIVIAILTAVCIFGGVQRIAKISELFVPAAAIVYILVCLFIVVMNIANIPAMFSTIINSAFGMREAASGALGAAIMHGTKRGLFSNEAGMGSAPNAAATADTSHPVKQGLIQSLSVLIDTIVISTATGFAILSTGVYQGSANQGIVLAQEAFSSQLGSWASIFLAVTIFLFCFTSVVGNYYYGETNIEFMNSNKSLLLGYRLMVVGMVIFGALAHVQVVWDLADLFMALMALINLYAIARLYPAAIEALKDYTIQKKAGLDPVFYAGALSNPENIDCWPMSDPIEEEISA